MNAVRELTFAEIDGMRRRGELECTCYGDDIPSPDSVGMCPDCMRLAKPKR